MPITRLTKTSTKETGTGTELRRRKEVRWSGVKLPGGPRIPLWVVFMGLLFLGYLVAFSRDKAREADEAGGLDPTTMESAKVDLSETTLENLAILLREDRSICVAGYNALPYTFPALEVSDLMGLCDEICEDRDQICSDGFCIDGIWCARSCWSKGLVCSRMRGFKNTPFCRNPTALEAPLLPECLDGNAYSSAFDGYRCGGYSTTVPNGKECSIGVLEVYIVPEKSNSGRNESHYGHGGIIGKGNPVRVP